MVDPGTISSATQLVQQTFHLYRHVAAARKFADTAGNYAGMIAFEYFRFETWIQQSGLLTTDASGNPEITEESIRCCIDASWNLKSGPIDKEALQSNIVRIIGEVHRVLGALDKLKAKYRLNIDEDASEQASSNEQSSPGGPEPPGGNSSKAVFRSPLGAKAINSANRRRWALACRVTFFRKVNFGWALNDDTSDRQKIADHINTLKYYNDGLREMMPPRERKFADVVASVRAVSLSEESAELANIASAAQAVSGQLYHDISAACSIKAERIQQQQESATRCAASSSSVGPKKLKKNQIAKFDQLSQLAQKKQRHVTSYFPVDAPKTPESGTPVVVEFVVFDELSLSPEESGILQERIGQLCELLQRIDRPSTFLFPLSVGYLSYSPAQFAITYQLPDFADTCRDTYSLYSIIRRNPRSQKEFKSLQLWPTLEQKYQLAAILAEGLLSLLNVNWVHKAITSANIVLFHENGSVNAVEFSRPQIMGFGVSRPDRPGDPTIDVRSLDSPWNLWQHRELRAGPHRRYQRHHDIYSLGMVLFEIGMWNDLHYFTAPGDDASVFHNRVVNVCNQRLAHYMGEAYRDVVLMCINNDDAWVEAGKKDDGGGTLLELFSWDVVRVLKSCGADIRDA